MQPELKAKLQKAADRKGVSLNEFITSTLSDVFRAHDASRVVIVNLPSYLKTALLLDTDYEARPLEDAILDILRRQFPNAVGAEAIERVTNTAFTELERLEDLVESNIDTGDLSSAILELSEMLHSNLRSPPKADTPTDPT